MSSDAGRDAERTASVDGTAHFGCDTSLLTGIMNVQCTYDLKGEIGKNGKSACVPITDEIRRMDDAADVWHPRDGRTDMIVEVDVPDRAAADRPGSAIAGLDGSARCIRTSLQS